MRTILSSNVLILLTTCLIGVAGCAQDEKRSPASGASTHAHGHSHTHGHSHDHGHVHGPNGGHIIDLGSEDYHAEVTHAEPTQTVGVYILGADAATAAPVDAASITIYASADGNVTEYVLPAVPQSNDAAGESSYFELKNERLQRLIAGASPAANSQFRLSITIDGLPYVGTIDTKLDHHGPPVAHVHGKDDALVWRKEISEQGYDIALGHHGITLLAGGELEPAVRIIRDGQPVAEAQVFNALVAEDGNAILAEEVPTVYEPPSSDEPAHYAQGQLRIPPGTRQATIRYRILLPGDKTEHVFDLPVAVK